MAPRRTSTKTASSSYSSLANAARTFDQYVIEVISFPGFLRFNEQSSSFQLSINIDLMLNDIKSAYDGVVDLDPEKILESIQRMGDTVLYQSHAEESRSLFAQAAVRAADDSTKVEISIFYTAFRMKKNTSEKKTYTEQSYTVNRTVFEVIPSFLIEAADDLSQTITKNSIGGWLGKTSSPTGGTKVKSCFRTHIEAMEKEN
ncbi:hypothetical protein BGX29_011336 [Mortierella sp. GBA35]|nr:hypothetical protein BGX29_011336 [Mortierella sp. GBA35]